MLVAQLEEASDLNSVQCRFESYRVHKSRKTINGVFSLTGKVLDCESREQGSRPENTQKIGEEVRRA